MRDTADMPLHMLSLDDEVNSPSGSLIQPSTTCVWTNLKSFLVGATLSGVWAVVFRTTRDSSTINCAVPILWAVALGSTCLRGSRKLVTLIRCGGVIQARDTALEGKRGNLRREQRCRAGATYSGALWVRISHVRAWRGRGCCCYGLT